MAERKPISVGEYGYEGGYGSVVDSLGYEILIEESDDDYQGDSLMLLRDASRYGVLRFGWGSCSGCDALQAVTTDAELEELRTDLDRGIEWFPTRDEAVQHVLTGKDWEGSYAAEETVARFKKAVEAVTA